MSQWPILELSSRKYLEAYTSPERSGLARQSSHQIQATTAWKVDLSVRPDWISLHHSRYIKIILGVRLLNILQGSIAKQLVSKSLKKQTLQLICMYYLNTGNVALCAIWNEDFRFFDTHICVNCLSNRLPQWLQDWIELLCEKNKDMALLISCQHIGDPAFSAKRPHYGLEFQI